MNWLTGKQQDFKKLSNMLRPQVVNYIGEMPLFGMDTHHLHLHTLLSIKFITGMDGSLKSQRTGCQIGSGVCI